MQNFEEIKAGHVGEGIYMCKLTPFQGASKLHSTMTMELPWFYIEGIETFREYVVTLGHFHLHKYRMTPTHRGCRFHAKALLEIEIDAFMTTLDITNEKLDWKPVVSAHSLTTAKFKKARAKEDKERSAWYFARYFNLKGEDHEVAKEEGEFIYDLPSGQAMKAWCQNGLPYLLTPLWRRKSGLFYASGDSVTVAAARGDFVVP